MRVYVGFMAWSALTASLMAAGPDASSSKNPISSTADALLAQEAQGIPTDRRALATDNPSSDLCRWLSGSIKSDGQWQAIDQLTGDTDPKLMAAYREMRSAETLTAERHRQLARWCAKNGLEAQAIAHWNAVLAANENDLEARSQLKHSWVSGSWYTREQIARADAMREQLTKDLHKWSAPCQKILKGLNSNDVDAQKQALSKLKAIDDPSAIAALEVACLQVNEESAGPIITAIAQHRTPAACGALTRIALVDPQSSRGELALSKVKEYPLEFYVPELLGMLSTPVETLVEYGVNNLGELQVRRAMFRTTNTERQLVEYNRLVRVNEPVAMQIDLKGFVSFRMQINDQLYSVKGQSSNQASTNVPIDEIAAAKAAVEDQAELDRRIADFNRENERKSKNVNLALTRLTGQPLQGPESWWEWWRKYNHRSKTAKPFTRKTYNQVDKAKLVLGDMKYRGTIQMSCLVAGTPIQTSTGLRPVQSIQIGDLVLSQNVESGELSLRPVIGTTLRPPQPIYCIKTEEGDIRATGGHRWWVAGKGWVMSDHLEPDMLLHNAQGTTKIVAIEEEPDPQPTHNLIVDGFHTYFVGKDRVLSFDNVDPVPTLRKVPGY